MSPSERIIFAFESAIACSTVPAGTVHGPDALRDNLDEPRHRLRECTDVNDGAVPARGYWYDVKIINGSPGVVKHKFRHLAKPAFKGSSGSSWIIAPKTMP
jgi:hypothetical protein